MTGGGTLYDMVLMLKLMLYLKLSSWTFVMAPNLKLCNFVPEMPRFYSKKRKFLVQVWIMAQTIDFIRSHTVLLSDTGLYAIVVYILFVTI